MVRLSFAPFLQIVCNYVSANELQQHEGALPLLKETVE